MSEKIKKEEKFQHRVKWFGAVLNCIIPILVQVTGLLAILRRHNGKNVRSLKHWNYITLGLVDVLQIFSGALFSISLFSIYRALKAEDMRQNETTSVNTCMIVVYLTAFIFLALGIIAQSVFYFGWDAHNVTPKIVLRMVSGGMRYRSPYCIENLPGSLFQAC